MIALLKGTITHKTKDTIFLMTDGGVGYEIKLQPLVVLELSTDALITLFTYLKVSDSTQELYGFRTLEEREFFMLLMTVSGIGPKSALTILSLGSINQISDAIARGDVKYLTAVQGMGKKTAERLVVELKTKVKAGGESRISGASDTIADVVEGLVAMGYSREEVKRVAQQIETKDKTSEQLLRDMLRHLSRS